MASFSNICFWYVYCAGSARETMMSIGLTRRLCETASGPAPSGMTHSQPGELTERGPLSESGQYLNTGGEKPRPDVTHVTGRAAGSGRTSGAITAPPRRLRGELSGLVSPGYPRSGL